MPKFKVGETVIWKYQGDKTTSGQIIEVKAGGNDKNTSAKVGINNNQITKPATDQRPAYLIKTKSGKEVIHSEDELSKE